MSKNVKIVFTSCVRYDKFPIQPQWAEIDEVNPDYLFLLGDQIYMDYGVLPFIRERGGKPCKYPDSKFENIMNMKYSQQWGESNYAKLYFKMKNKNGFYGTWDDHDFICNNACGGDDGLEEKRNISRNLFHKWMNCSTNVPEVYYHVDIPLARVIFLDTRYYAKSDRSILLGNKQFEFLEEKIKHDKKYTILCSGLTLTSGKERWSKFKGDYEKFKDIIRNVNNVIFLSGDIHKNKLLAPSERKPCYEIISSGLAINYFGLPSWIDSRHNWAQLDIDDNSILIQFNSKKKIKKYCIDTLTWELKDQ